MGCMIRKYSNPVIWDFKASNEWRPQLLDTEEHVRFQSTGFCSGMHFKITQMYGGECGEAGTGGRELWDKGSMGQGSGEGKEMNLKTSTCRNC